MQHVSSEVRLIVPRRGKRVGAFFPFSHTSLVLCIRQRPWQAKRPWTVRIYVVGRANVLVQNISNLKELCDVPL